VSDSFKYKYVRIRTTKEGVPHQRSQYLLFLFP